MPAAIVLGASGFIGRHVADAFRGLPDVDVVGVGLGEALPDFAAPWLDVDLLAENPTDVAARFREHDPVVVVNCTGSTIGSPSDLVRSNVLATARLLEVLEQCGPVRLVQIGSAAEYGRSEAGSFVTETTCAWPLGAYGLTKLAATQLVVTAAAAGRLDGVVLRVFNALGPGMPEHTLPGAAQRRLAAAIAAGAPSIDMGPLTSVRDFVDVRDIATAVVAAAVRPGTAPPIVNVGTGAARSSRELAEAMAVGIGFNGTIGEAAAGSPRSTDVPWLVADATLAARSLGWRPRHDLASSVRFMLDGPAGAGNRKQEPR